MDDLLFDQPTFDTMVIDADTLVFRAAVVLQRASVVVTHIKSGQQKVFKNKTEFYGHHSKKAGGWLAEVNLKRSEVEKPPFLVEDFKIEDRIEPNPDMKNHIKEGLKIFKRNLDTIKGEKFASKYILLLGNGGNFRDVVAKTLKYKGDRPPKPIMLAELKKAIIKKFKRNIELVSGIEADDRAAWYGVKNIKHFKEHGFWKYLLAYIDKDLKMISSPALNYDDLESGCYIINSHEAAEHFAKQLLTGDKSVDNVLGLPTFADTTKKKYGLPNRKGLGEATALKYLAGCETIPELFGRVCEAYRDYYGVDKKAFTAWDGEVLHWDWKDYLRETGLLIFMSPLKDPLKFDVIKMVEKMGINTDEETTECDSPGVTNQGEPTKEDDERQDDGIKPE